MNVIDRSDEKTEETTDAVELAASERKHDALTEKDYLRSITTELKMMNLYFREMTGIEINEKDLEQTK